MAAALMSCCCGTADRDEVARLARLLNWKRGAVVADVGAGKGEMARAASALVGEPGRVYATELDPGKLSGLRTLESRYRNLRVAAGSAGAVGLPPACCDSAVLRGVYHHLTNPRAFDDDLFGALKPGGRIAVIDFAPKRLLGWLFPVEGVPENRGGHGIPQAVVTEELKRSGFTIEAEIPNWPGGQYCVIAKKPGSGS